MGNPPKGLKRLYGFPFRLVVVIALGISSAEALVMVILAHLPPLPLWLTTIIDSLFLLLLLIPVFIHLIFRPLVMQTTERNRTAEALKLERNKLRGILDAMEDGVYIVNQRYEIEYINSALEREFGPVAGRKCYEYFSGSTELCPWCRHHVFISGKPQKVEWQSLRSGRYFEISASPVAGENGTLAMLEVLHDVTERRRTEEKVRTLSRAVEQSPSCIVIADKAGTIEYVNPKFSELTGYSLEEAVGKNPNILKTGYTTAEEYRQLWGTILSGREWRGEFVNRKKNGEIYWESASIAPVVNAKGVITNFVAVKEDITERKRFEVELFTSREQLRNLSNHLQRVREEERAAITREIHDELGQTLATLQLSVALIERELRPNQTYLHRQTQEMSLLISDTVKTVQRLCAALRPLMLDELGLADALEWQAREVEKKSGIRCEMTVAPDISDPGQEMSIALFRIFQESLTNVLRHAGATMVKARLTRRRNRMVLAVRDNGKGIARNQLNSTISFGLIGMRERAAALGGKVRICGGPGRGTVVLARIPLKMGEVHNGTAQKNPHS
ncbi:PAS domain-containing sensor histidine kinase [Geobacter pickeringii]|uniref:PAS domain-containing sensor histidine kinase n=1 Tax=Geobacter pickeringii TaxID=345632 RepID=UPI00068C40BD|nr:sensor histidine kinase [Geobacter pickeringii]